ncbi:NtaA/DmoA family FMN-dependent monooxygenase [Cryobacterium arcticum]|uniref:FMNH2-dependent monooxygenase n=1 Tax=Cryobacterium arcticum TaxID=670052 RepID=A0A318A7Z0_9MICO|nr:NtaA/DmoA family FMN-dependent monooxygenase [Cryobacterium arcticum]PXA73313.1 FMNH2-dependent monooxygenase [Cryobacterium arcticum]
MTTPASPLTFGWFLNFMPPAWNGTWRSNHRDRWMDGDFYVDVARQLEAACIDFLLLEDSVMVPDTYGGTMEAELRFTTRSPKGDPLPLIPKLARATQHIGFAATMSTSLYPPFMLARLLTTLDHITEGRVAWNLVTSAEDRAAQNFGQNTLPSHSERYQRADEYAELVTQLWDSWDDDALVMDRAAGRYVDHTRVRPINFDGAYYRSRGPLNTLPGPQRHPMIFQAGSSPAGRELAAKHAEVVLASMTSPTQMREFRDDLRSRTAAAGRDPDTLKVLYLVQPIIAETIQEAEIRRERAYAPTDENVIARLVHMSSGDIDFSTLDLDAPIPDDLETNGITSGLENLRRIGRGRTLREAAASRIESVELVGTPDSVADRMAEVIDEVGGDGFLFFGGGGGRLSRHYVAEITEGLMPALQDRGLARTSPGQGTFRESVFGAGTARL